MCENKAPFAPLTWPRDPPGSRDLASGDYCTHLKNAMCQYIPKFKKFAYAINVRPTFFDISDVANPADRIAHHIQYMFADGAEMAKAASGEFPFSDMLAERAGVVLPDNDAVLGCSDPRCQNHLTKLAAAEQYLCAVATQPGNVSKDEKFHFVKDAAQHAFDYAPLTDEDLKTKCL